MTIAALSASVLLAALGAWALFQDRSGDPPNVAKNPTGNQIRDRDRNAHASPPDHPDGRSEITPGVKIVTPDRGDGFDPSRPDGREKIVGRDIPDDPGGVAAPDPETPRAPGDPPAYLASTRTEGELLAEINRLIRLGWELEGVEPAEQADDAAWCRRVFIDVIGRIPTAKESLAFIDDDARDKKSRLVHRLLNAEEYVEQYARNWTGIWTNMLIGRGGDNRGLVNRQGLQQYLRRSFLRGKPYDEMVHELISATGSNTPGEEDFNGAVNFVLDNLQEKSTPATAKTARLFMGIQLQCTQCHNHPFNKETQNQFWEMNSFFRQARALRTRDRNGQASARLVDVDFRGEGNNPNAAMKEAEVYYEQLNGILKVAFPAFVNGEKINPSGRVEDVNRRQTLADFVVKSDYLSETIVNRMWAHFLGVGFTRPIDDMGPHSRRSHPELLSQLALEFSLRGHDLRQLIRWVTLSEAYSLSSQSPQPDRDDPATGEPPLFSHFYMRQLRAEELYESLLVTCEAHQDGGSVAEREKAKSDWLQQFAIVYDTDENDEATTFDGGVSQSLVVWNGPMVKRATSSKSNKLLRRLSQSKVSDRQKINTLYLATLGRRPNRNELQTAGKALAARGGEALEDIMWALLNGGEFILQH